MPPAIIAAGIGAAASIGGGIMSANAQKKATNKATDAALQTAQMNNALTEKVYAQNQANLSPYNARGNAAGNQINAMLGLSPAPLAAPSLPQPTGPIGNTGGAGGAVGSGYGGVVHSPAGSRAYPNVRQINEPANLSNFAAARASFANGQGGMPISSVNTPSATAGGPAPAAANPWDPFKQYLQGSDYAFQLGQGDKGLNQGYAANGMLESGAAMKALEKYHQDLQAGYRGEYMGLLSNQQGVGLSGASAIAGVGQNYVNNVSANNNSAGTAAANAALARGAANSNLYAGIGNSLGNLAGGLFGGSSYGGGSLQNDVRGMMLANPNVF